MKNFKKILLPILGIFVFMFSLTSCKNDTTKDNQNDVNQNGTKEQFVVEFNSNGGTDIASQTINDGDLATKPSNPVKERYEAKSYEFDNWYVDNNFNEVFDFNTPVTSNLVLYAKWIEGVASYSIEFIDYDNSLISSSSYGYGDTVVEPTFTPRANDDDNIYTFIGWDSDITNVTADKTYKAVYSNMPIAKITNISDISKEFDEEEVDTPTFDVNSDGDVTIEYKSIDDLDSMYSEDKPIYSGKYVLRITVADTETVKGTSITQNFEITTETYQILILEYRAKIELLLDKTGYVITQTALDFKAIPIVSNENYIGLSKHQAVKKFGDDLYEYGLKSKNESGTIYLKYSVYNEGTILYNELWDYISSKYGATDNSSNVSSINEYDLRSMAPEYIYTYTYSEIQNMSFEQIINELVEVRTDTASIVNLEAKRLYAIYLAKSIYGVMLSSLADTITDSQMPKYGSIRSGLVNQLNSYDSAFEDYVLQFNNSYYSDVTSYGVAREKYATIYNEYLEAISNDSPKQDIYKFILFTILVGSLDGNQTGARYSFISVTNQFSSFLSNYNSYKSQIDAACAENNVDFDSILAAQMPSLKRAALEFALNYDTNYFELSDIVAKGTPLYYFADPKANETYSFNQISYGNYICYIYDGIIEEDKLVNYKPSRYCNFSKGDNYISVEDYYHQTTKYISIASDDTLYMDKLAEGEIEYILYSSTYGRGTYSFNIVDGKKVLYSYTGCYTKEELEKNFVQYSSVYDWYILNDHIIQVMDNYVGNYVVDNGIYLKNYEINLADLELKYIGHLDNGYNLGFVTVDGINYLLVYEIRENNVCVSLTYDELASIINTTKPVYGTDGSLLWEIDADGIIKTGIPYFNSSYAFMLEGNVVKDVTNDIKIKELRYVTNLEVDSTNYVAALVYYETYLGKKRYEVRLYESGTNKEYILNDLENADFEINGLAWAESDDAVVIYRMDNEETIYTDTALGYVIKQYSKDNDDIKDFTEEEKVFKYYYYDKGSEKTYALYGINGLKIAYVYSGLVEIDDLGTQSEFDSIVLWNNKFIKVYNTDGVIVGSIYMSGSYYGLKITKDSNVLEKTSATFR